MKIHTINSYRKVIIFIVILTFAFSFVLYLPQNSGAQILPVTMLRKFYPTPLYALACMFPCMFCFVLFCHIMYGCFVCILYAYICTEADLRGEGGSAGGTRPSYFLQ